MKNLCEGRNKMKTSMKKNAKAFLAILFSAVLVFEAWGGTSVISDTATSTQSIVPAARILQAQLICDRMQSYIDAGTPVILAGDFNSAPGQGDAYETIIERGYQCTRDYAQTADTHGAYTAFNRTDVDTFAKGDHIFTSAHCTAELYDVLSDEDIDPETGYHVSDHCPILATIQY